MADAGSILREQVSHWMIHNADVSLFVRFGEKKQFNNNSTEKNNELQ